MTAVLRTDVSSVPQYKTEARADRSAEKTSPKVWIRIIENPSDIEADWRALQSAGIASIFQSYDWVVGFCSGAAQAFDEQPIIFAGYTANGKLALVLPMAIKRRKGMHVLTWLGSRCSTSNIGIFGSTASHAGPSEVADWFRQIARLRPDVVAAELSSQPPSWDGIPNPLLAAIPTRNSGECERIIPLVDSFETLFAARFSKDRRSRIKKYERRINELGEVTWKVAKTPGEKICVIDAFISQKLAQLAETRSLSIFEKPEVKEFLNEMCDTLGKDHEVEAQSLVINGDIAATRWGMRFKDRFYAYGESMNSGPVRQRSPGTQLTIQCLSREFQKGTRIYDMGPGPGPHKDVWGPTDSPLMNSFIIFKTRGWLTIGPDLTRDFLKRTVRKYPRLLGAWRSMRYTFRGFKQTDRTPQASD